MATMNVLDSVGSTVAVEKPLTPGQALMALSRPVVIASDQSAVPVSGTITANIGTGTLAAVSTVTSLSQFAGNAINLGAGAVGTGTLRTTQASDSPLVTATGAVADAAAANGASGTALAYLRAIKDVATDNSTASLVKLDQTGTNNAVAPVSTAYALIAAPSTYRLLSAAATTNGANIKASAGAVKGIQGYNAKASAVYLKLYNKASSPTVGTDTPVKTIYLPATAAFAFDFGTGVNFATGISIALTGAGADADTTAIASGDILALNVDYH